MALKPADIRSILASHDLYFESARIEMRECKALYMTRFWRNRNGVTTANRVMTTEVPKGYEIVESYLGSLYAKNPAVRVEPDLRDRGNPAVAQATANQFLLNVREQLEDATRLALIYPCAFLKLAPVESTDPLKRVSCGALPPWEVIVDSTATSWTAQRFVGHVYLMPLTEAATRFSKSEPDFRPRVSSKWIDGDQARVGGMASPTSMPGGPGMGDPQSDTDKWVRVVEMYDMLADKLLVWSPDYKDGNDFLFEGVKVQVGALDLAATADSEQADAELVHETSGIPYKSASGRPIVPIIPLYFSRDPDTPLRGYSLVERSKDQLRELNLMRTYSAQGVRRMARQWLVRGGFLGQDAAAKISQGVDGEMIEVDLQPGLPLEGNIIPVPQASMPPDIEAYSLQIAADIRDASMLAPFTRGEATGATATENTLLAAYTSSEIGRMARARDGVITGIAMAYNVMLSVVLGEDAEPLALPNPVGPTVLSADDLTGDFGYWAIDAGTTPVSDATKQQSLERLSPVLVQLGADPKAVLEEIVRAFQLPQDLGKSLPPAPPPGAPTAAPPEGAEPPAPAPVEMI